MNKNKYYIIIAIASAMLFACNFSPIEVEKFTEYSKINQNEKAKIYWKFKNAQGVAIEGYNNVFAAEDSLEVSTSTNKTLYFSAYRNNLDTVRRSCVIEVQKPEVVEEKSITSKVPSEYLISLKDENRKIEHIKFAGYDYSPENNSLEIKLLTFDEFGGLAFDNELNETLIKKMNIYCGENNIDIQPKIEYIKNEKIKPVEFNFLFDNSMMAEEGFKPEIIVNDFSKKLSENDKMNYSEYNLNFHPIAKDLTKKSTNSALQSYTPSPREGMNSLYKSMFNSLEEIKSSPESNQMMVVLTYNSDNSSILYFADDITALSAAKNIPIYFIAIGGGLNTYALRYISSITGGKFYHIDNDELSSIDGILSEIYNSQNHYIKLTYDLTNNNKCNKMLTIFDFDQNEKHYYDKLQVFLSKQAQYQSYQALAVFDFKSSTYNKIYDENIELLALNLKENPDAQIVLIGNAGNEGNSEYCDKMGMVRSEDVKKALIMYGAKDNQVKIKSNGNHKMLYNMENEIWQGYLNRRVEVKWLDPSILPFELCGSKYYNSEELAISAMEKWENKGFKAYYDRINIDDSPFYRIKFWGYATEDEAKTEVRRINKDYKENFTIE